MKIVYTASVKFQLNDSEMEHLKKCKICSRSGIVNFSGFSKIPVNYISRFFSTLTE